MSQHTINLHPFTVPNFVRPIMSPGKRQDGFVESLAIPLSDLSVEALDEMCCEFRAAVFAKARKEDGVKSRQTLKEMAAVHRFQAS